MLKPTLLMIRPHRQATEFVQALPKLSSHVIYAPVLEIQQRPLDPIPSDTQALLFSSVNGVTYFAEQSDNRRLPAYCVGETTAAAATKAGFIAHSADGTAADLLALAKANLKPKDGAVIYISGAMVAHDLDSQLKSLGYDAARRIVYEQSPQVLTPQAIDALKSPTVIPVSSPNTAHLFAEQTADLDLSLATFIFISENARAPLKHAKSKQILAESPTRAAMLAAVDAHL